MKIDILFDAKPIRKWTYKLAQSIKILLKKK